MTSLTPRQKLDRLEPLTLVEFATLAGCGRSQVRKWMEATSPPTLATYRIGRHHRVRAEEAVRFLAEIGALSAAKVA